MLVCVAAYKNIDKKIFRNTVRIARLIEGWSASICGLKSCDFHP
jgi:hypothetical protein